VQIEIVATGSLSTSVRDELLALLRTACDEELSTSLQDIGPGLHLLGRVDGALMPHVMIVPRALQAASIGSLHTAYIELVATEPEAQGRGYASTLLRESVALMGDFDIAALSPSAESFYARLGWESWRGPLLVRTKSEVIPSPEEQVMILRLPRTPELLDLDAPLSIDWRAGEVWWTRERTEGAGRRCGWGCRQVRASTAHGRHQPAGAPYGTLHAARTTFRQYPPKHPYSAAPPLRPSPPPIPATYMHASSLRTLLALAATAALAACAPSRKPDTAPSPASDPRNALKAGLFDAAEYTSNLKVIAKAVSPKGFLGETNSDLAFTGNYVIQGNYNGPVIWDISVPSQPQLVVAYECPASQNDVSVYKNLMFMSAEAMNGRIDCKPGGVKEPVSNERLRGVRIFDISNIREPKLVANVQTCRGSHTHTVLEDPKDKQNVYIYVSGSSGIRPAGELAECVSNVPSGEANSSRLRIEIIKVPLADPSKAAVVGRANIFAGLGATKSHGASPADKAEMDAAKAKGAFTIMIPAMGQEVMLPEQFVKPVLDSIMKARGATTANAADSAAARPLVNANVMKVLAAQGMDKPPAPVAPSTTISEGSQCHDITVYPALGLAGGACEGHGLLLDISNPVAPFRLDAVADSNFAYWHSATFNNDGTKMLFSDEWGGGGSPKCRPLDKPEWGANAIFEIVNKKLVFKSYYKIPTYQTSNENCVAHNGSLIPIPGRDVMVQSWYQGGISVFDWTDAANPKEIASFDRGPVDSTRMQMGGSWSVYWYNGSIVSSEIARGMDVAQLVPSQYISQNEIDAANTVKWDYLNAQGQPKIVWPPSFALAKAFTDQLERKGCVASSRISDIRSQISNAEKASGAARNSGLTRLISDLDGSRDCDPNKIDMLKKALQDLKPPAM